MTNSSKPIVYSPQQISLFDWVKKGSGSSFVQAVAGAGKTTTLVKSTTFMSGHVYMIVFNKKNADEMAIKLKEAGSKAWSGTFHSVGLGAWRKVHPQVQVEQYKIHNLVKNEEMCIPEGLQTFVRNLVSLARQKAIGLYGNIADVKEWWDIIDHFDMLESLEEPNDAEKGIELAQKVLAKSIEMAPNVVDFDDMIYMPVITPCRLFQQDWVLVDEAQDTNPARRALVRKMLKPNGRAIFVGDVHQAIYGFTGADADAVDQIVKDFNCKLLPLTVTYRCPKNVVKMAQTVVSHIEAHESAPEGVVNTIYNNEVHEKNLQAHDAILCRNTKPLVELAFQLIRKNIACHVEGKDIGQGLLNLVNRWKVKSIDALRNNLEKYLERETQKLVAKGRETLAEAIKDRVETIYVLMDGCPDVDCIRNKIKSLFQDSDGEQKKTLTLSTVHKAKGREWDRVFVLGYNKYFPSKFARQAWQIQQENNLIYVAYTRSKNELILVDGNDKIKEKTENKKVIENV